jgi:hypothetical protein
MANRRDFFFRQKVTEAELDAAFAELENADRALASDFGHVGVTAGMAVTQQVSPNLTVQVSGPGVVYDQTGQRIAIPSTQTVNCAVDEDGLNTAVVGGTNSRILSIFAEFNRVLSDPRVDGNAATVYFVRAESFTFNVAAGTESASPVAPALRGDQILLADITLAYGASSIVNGNISTTRRQWAYKTTGTVIGVGTAEEAIQALATALAGTGGSLSAHVAASPAHAGSAVSFSPTGNVAATNVQTAIAELDTEKLARAGGVMLGNIDMDGFDIIDVDDINADAVTVNTGEYGFSPARLRTFLIPMQGWTRYASTVAEDKIQFQGGLPGIQSTGIRIDADSGRLQRSLNEFLKHNEIISNVRMICTPGAARTGGDRMQLALLYKVPDFATPNGDPDPVSIASAFDDTTANEQVIDLSSGLGGGHTVVTTGATNTAREYWLAIKGGVDADTNNDLVWAVAVSVVISDVRTH